MMVERAEDICTFPSFWTMFAHEVPLFPQVVLLTREKLEARIHSYVTEKALVIPDFTSIQTVEALFATGWRFHKTHWGMLVPPGCPIEQMTVAIHCQLCGEAVIGWDKKIYTLTIKTPSEQARGTTQTVEQLCVCAKHTTIASGLASKAN